MCKIFNSTSKEDRRTGKRFQFHIGLALGSAVGWGSVAGLAVCIGGRKFNESKMLWGIAGECAVKNRLMTTVEEEEVDGGKVKAVDRLKRIHIRIPCQAH